MSDSPHEFRHLSRVPKELLQQIMPYLLFTPWRQLPKYIQERVVSFLNSTDRQALGYTAKHEYHLVNMFHIHKMNRQLGIKSDEFKADTKRVYAELMWIYKLFRREIKVIKSIAKKNRTKYYGNITDLYTTVYKSLHIIPERVGDDRFHLYLNQFFSGLSTHQCMEVINELGAEFLCTIAQSGFSRSVRFLLDYFLNDRLGCESFIRRALQQRIPESKFQMVFNTILKSCPFESVRFAYLPMVANLGFIDTVKIILSHCQSYESRDENLLKWGGYALISAVQRAERHGATITRRILNACSTDKVKETLLLTRTDYDATLISLAMVYGSPEIIVSLIQACPTYRLKKQMLYAKYGSHAIYAKVTVLEPDFRPEYYGKNAVYLDLMDHLQIDALMIFDILKDKLSKPCQQHLFHKVMVNALVEHADTDIPADDEAWQDRIALCIKFQDQLCHALLQAAECNLANILPLLITVSTPNTLLNQIFKVNPNTTYDQVVDYGYSLFSSQPATPRNLSLLLDAIKQGSGVQMTALSK